MVRTINKLFTFALLLLQAGIIMAYVPREFNEPLLSQEETNNINNKNIIGISKIVASRPELEHYLYSIIDFNSMSLESIDNVAKKLSLNQDLSNTLQNYYRPKSIVAIVEKLENLNLKDLGSYRKYNPQYLAVVDELLSLAIDSISSDIYFEEYLYLKNCKLLGDSKKDKDAYQSGKSEYIASINHSIDEYLDYESSLFNAVFYLESIKAYGRLNAVFEEMVKTYSQYEAPKDADKMKIGFEKLINSYDSQKNVTIVEQKMEKFLNQCNVNRQTILESFFLLDDMAPNSQELNLKMTSPQKFNYRASASGFNEFYSYKSSLDKKNATVGLASSVISLFTGFLGSMVVDAASGAYKSSNIKDIANKDYNTRKIYIQDAYNKSCSNLNDQLTKLENNLRNQYNHNKKNLKNDLSSFK